MTKGAFRSIQTGLHTLGYTPGPIDGMDGPKTRMAALAFGSDAPGKPAAGVIKPSTSAMIYQGASRHPVREIIVHCSATRPEWMDGRPIAEKVAEIRRWHLANGWNDIGYHWIIDRPGKVLVGRGETVIGAHTVGKNSGTIGVCLIGGHGSAETDSFSDHYTRAQDVTLGQMIDAISSRTQIERVSGHNEYAAKACPGFNVPKWIEGRA
ncbi:peptidoglycan recognition protein family protein [Paracoccus benzoatiresistens]|uniref:N-acetylmuramoyl-L-alanine amidase n=1 Tax=Paracoccus benzoatiresistens TaxID=2997341 RepID=A0ABT4JB18_9RHOB|nr:N-acetylmuramoyl-L-alanine amidase [Paracoccus sp. EF6]MCZ0963905.1 N-acetylmuramoyl-L-alanine amidase [Paracoccus sp. EF6]